MVRTWLEISLKRIRHNYGIIRKMMPREVPVIAVVKADAYGHGAIPVAGTLFEAGVRSFAVACLDEAAEIREVLPPSTEIIVFGGLEEGRSAAYRKLNITASIYDSVSIPPGISVQAEIDTGMGRLGFNWENFSRLFGPEREGLTGVYSHFSSADESPEFTEEQLRRFREATKGIQVRKHISNSAGLRFPKAHLDSVRPGLALYGISPCDGFDGLRPAMCWKARILSVRELPSGTPVGYSRTFITSRPSRVGILPLGYADGYNRLLSGRGSVGLEKGAQVPVIGIVSMDLTAVDLTDHPEIQPGDAVTLISSDPDSEFSAAATAGKIGTIPYEILTSIGNRVERRYVDF